MADFKFDVTESEDLNRLESEIFKSRKNEGFVLEFRKMPEKMPVDPEDVSELLDAFTSQQGFKDIGEAWIEVSRNTAVRILIHALSKGLAYGMIFMEKEEAGEIAEKFLNLFREGSHYFCNGDCVVGSVKTVDGKTVPGFKPITKATLDTGVIALDSDHIGMLWAWDED
ncbi:MAG: hypothetical protein ACYS8W_02080 [Planctomycetota bacterium]|jgi:hypothetical protein